MKKPMKVALLSGLVFPGIGHFVLKKYYRAFTFALSFAVLLSIYINDVFYKTQLIVEKIQQGKIALNANAISQAIENLSIGYNSEQLNLLGYVLLSIWLLAIVDAYRVAVPLAKVETKTE
jgi:hypothetical protein